MNWPDERYVRLYTRDTADWLALSFDAQALFALLLRKVDRAGILQLGKTGKRAVAVVLNQVSLWEDRLEPALGELLKDGVVVLKGRQLIIRNYVAAQEAVASAKARMAAHRERRKLLDGNPYASDETSPDGDGNKRGVTRGDSSLAVPSLAVPKDLNKNRGAQSEASQMSPVKSGAPPSLEKLFPETILAKLRGHASGVLDLERLRVEAEKVSSSVRLAAAEKFIREDAGRGKKLGYLVGIIRGMAAEERGPRGGKSNTGGSTGRPVEIPSAEETRARLEREREELKSVPKLSPSQLQAAIARGREEAKTLRNGHAKNHVAKTVERR